MKKLMLMILMAAGIAQSQIMADDYTVAGASLLGGAGLFEAARRGLIDKTTALGTAAFAGGLYYAPKTTATLGSLYGAYRLGIPGMLHNKWFYGTPTIDVTYTEEEYRKALEIYMTAKYFYEIDHRKISGFQDIKEEYEKASNILKATDSRNYFLGVLADILVQNLYTYRSAGKGSPSCTKKFNNNNNGRMISTLTSYIHPILTACADIQGFLNYLNTKNNDTIPNQKIIDIARRIPYMYKIDKLSESIKAQILKQGYAIQTAIEDKSLAHLKSAIQEILNILKSQIKPPVKTVDRITQKPEDKPEEKEVKGEEGEGEGREGEEGAGEGEGEGEGKGERLDTDYEGIL